MFLTLWLDFEMVVVKEWRESGSLEEFGYFWLCIPRHHSVVRLSNSFMNHPPPHYIFFFF